jgi:hypothetical protein
MGKDESTAGSFFTQQVSGGTMLSGLSLPNRDESCLGPGRAGAVPECGCRHDGSDLAGQSATCGPFAKTGKSRQGHEHGVSDPYGPGLMEVAEALQESGSVLYPTGGWTAAVVVALDGRPDRGCGHERLGERYCVAQGTVGTLAEVRSHGVSRIAEQDQAAREPSSAVDPSNGIHEKVIEGRHSRQQIPGEGKYSSPLGGEGPEVAARHSVGHRG